jgi:uncharacterized SAM-binding protein YcdF (DUF218 family)
MTRLYDVGVVLGASVRPDGEAGPALLRRVAHAAALHRSGRVRWLLMSGGVGRRPPAEATLMREAALRAGVPDEAVLLDDRSRNTLENARFCREIIEAAGWRRILVVTDAYHLPRALYSFRRFGLRVDGEAVPGVPLDGEVIRAYLREMLALPVYLWRVERVVGAIRAASPRKAG